MRLLLIAAALVASSACSPEEQPESMPPMDRFYFPTGVATTRVDVGTATERTALLVASSNFDLRYSAALGGTLLSVDADASAWVAPQTATSLTLLGTGVNIASYSGPVAVADSTNCSGVITTEVKGNVLVASRYDDVLYRFDLGADGSLTCGAGKTCMFDLSGAARDPFGIAVACGASGKHAYVGFLKTPTSTHGTGEGAWIAEVDLADTAKAPRLIEVGDGSVRSMAYDPATDRLWIAARPDGKRAYLYSVDLSKPGWLGPSPWASVDVVNLFDLVPGLELKALAVGTSTVGGSRRLYATGRLYDVESQTSSGTRPAGDVGGVLLVLDVSDTPDPKTGAPVVTLVHQLKIGTGAADVAVISRGATERDVVLATALDGDVLWVYDDRDPVGAVAQVIGHQSNGVPWLGDRPVALAVDPTVDAGGNVTVYVGAFGSHLVTRFELYPAAPWGARVVPPPPTPPDPVLPPYMIPSESTLETIGGLAP